MHLSLVLVLLLVGVVSVYSTLRVKRGSAVHGYDLQSMNVHWRVILECCAVTPACWGEQQQVYPPVDEFHCQHFFLPFLVVSLSLPPSLQFLVSQSHLIPYHPHPLFPPPHSRSVC